MGFSEFGGFPDSSVGKESACMWETWVRSLVGKSPWNRERLPTPVLWPGESHGLYSPWGRKESDTTERLAFSEFGALYLGGVFLTLGQKELGQGKSVGVCVFNSYTSF